MEHVEINDSLDNILEVIPKTTFQKTVKFSTLFLVKYKSPEGIEAALKAGTHFYQSQEFKFIPYRIGDMESERQSRIVILANLPNITENDLIQRFEPEGIVAARIMDTKEFGYLLLAKKSTAQRMHKNSNLDFYHGHSKNHQIQTLDLSHVTKVQYFWKLGYNSKRENLLISCKFSSRLYRGSKYVTAVFRRYLFF